MYTFHAIMVSFYDMKLAYLNAKRARTQERIARLEGELLVRRALRAC
jgi:hypothetical protein